MNKVIPLPEISLELTDEEFKSYISSMAVKLNQVIKFYNDKSAVTYGTGTFTTLTTTTLESSGLTGIIDPSEDVGTDPVISIVSKQSDNTDVEVRPLLQIFNNETEVLTIDKDGNVGIGVTTPGALLDVDGDAVFNDSGADKDFRIEGDSKTNLFFIDAGNDRIGINTNAPTTLLHLVDKTADTLVKILVEAGHHAQIQLDCGFDDTAPPDAVSSIVHADTGTRTAEVGIDSGDSDKYKISVGAGGSFTDYVMVIDTSKYVAFGRTIPGQSYPNKCIMEFLGPVDEHSNIAINSIAADKVTGLSFVSADTWKWQIQNRGTFDAPNHRLGFWAGDDSLEKLYIEQDGTVTITSNELDMNTHQIVNVVDPTNKQDAATKEYVDTAIEFEFPYFLTNNASSDIGGYFQFDDDDQAGATQTITVANVAADATLIKAFATEPGIPGFSTFGSGIYNFHLHAFVSAVAGHKNITLYYEFYKRTHPGGVETLIFTSDESDVLTVASIAHLIHGNISTDEEIDATDRMVMKVYANVDGAGNDPDVSIDVEGTTLTRLEVPASASVLDTKYLKLSGGTMTGNLIVDGTIRANDKIFFTQADENEYIDSLNDGYLDIGATTMIRLNGVTLATDKIAFTQVDGDEYIDSIDDGFLDIEATTGIRIDGTTLHIDAANHKVGIGEAAPQEELEVNGKILVKDKIAFTQDDLAEYIDSLADGYLDFNATTALRLRTAGNIGINVSAAGEVTKPLNPVCRAWLSTQYDNLDTGVWAVCRFNAIDFEKPSSGANYSIANSRYDIPVTGVYYAHGHVTLTNVIVDKWYGVKLTVNGVQHSIAWSHSRLTSNFTLLISDILDLTVGDNIQVEVYSLDGVSTTDITANIADTFLTIQLIQ